MRTIYCGTFGTLRFEDDESKNGFGLFLRRMREKQGLSQRDVAVRLGLKNHNSYTELETGKRSPTLSTIERIVQALRPGARITLKISD